MAQKIVVIGPECTGKSTLTKALEAMLGVPSVPEYAREYLETLARPYQEADLLSIATGQMQLEDRAAALAGNGAYVCDTDLYVLKVWSEVRFGRCHRAILEGIATRPCALYLLTDIDLPWQDDPLREHPDVEDRRRLYLEYLDIVVGSGAAFVRIGGSAEERLAAALKAIARPPNDTFARRIDEPGFFAGAVPE